MIRRHFLIVAAHVGSVLAVVSPSSIHARGAPVKIGLAAASSGRSAASAGSGRGTIPRWKALLVRAGCADAQTPY